MNVSVIIPSLNPDEKLIMVVDSLLKKGFKDIILVNDGSDSNHIKPFEYLEQYEECTILTHEVNKGKGRGLKTAFEYCINNRPYIEGVVTVDGDNQHKAQDIYACCEKMIEEKDKIILGTRNFSGKDVPLKSRIGNNMTSFVFKFVCGINISDTQTGLRAIPRQYLELLESIEGERFEYETNMLLEMKRNYIEFEEVTIQTVYIEENTSTHFNPIKDSFRIYVIIFKFLFSSLFSCIVDLSVFGIISFLLKNKFRDSSRIFMATVIARIISSIVNYTMNRKTVFKSDSKVSTSVIKYYILCVSQMCVSYGLLFLITEIMSLGNVMIVIAKAVVDTFLFVISFQIQKNWVFKTTDLSCDNMMKVK